MKKSILVIEDEPFLGDVLCQKLRAEGFDATLIGDGAQGLKEMTSRKPDLVLLDIVLPTMSGYEVLEARQKNPSIASIPVIIISNSGQPVEISRTRTLGVVDYLIKAQMDPEEVLAKVRGYFEADSASAHAAATSEPRLKGYTVMWVEDDAFLNDIVAVKLTHEGCRALHAKDGPQALEFLKTEVPDVILLDLLLPGMSGFDVLKAIKQDPATKDIPVIVLSNLGQPQDIARVMELGGYKSLVKAEHNLDDIIDEILVLLKSMPALGSNHASAELSISES